MWYNFYWYQLVREVDGLDHWSVYVIKANGDEDARKKAQQHADILNDETIHEASIDRGRWLLHAYSKFDMSRINQGFPVRVGSFSFPVSEDFSRSDVSDA